MEVFGSFGGMKFVAIISVLSLLFSSCGNEEPISVRDETSRASNDSTINDTSNSYADEMIEVIELDMNTTLEVAYELALKNSIDLDTALLKVEETLGKKKIIKVGDYYWMKKDNGSYTAKPSVTEDIWLKTIDLNGAKAVKKFIDTQ